jgi:hypothetical protein
MTLISSNVGVGGTGGPSVDGTTASRGPTPSGLVVNSELLKQLIDMVGQVTPGKTSGTGDGLTNGRGAPSLEEPPSPISGDDMIALLRVMRTKSSDAQIASAKESLATAKIKAEKNTENQLDKIKEWVEKSKEADSKGILGKIFGWIGKIFAAIAAAVAVVVAAAATVATGGAAAPMLALASMALISATIALADQISQECGGPQISIGNLIGTITSKILEACGVDAETAAKIGKVMAGVVAIAMPVALLIEPQLLGTMATGICELAGADPKTTAIVGMVVSMAAAITVGIVAAVASGGTSAVSSAVKITNGLISSGAQIAQGLTSVATGAVNISVAKDRAEAENILASKKEMEAAMIKLQQQMEEDREEIKKVMQQIEDGVRAVSQIINGAAESMAQINANMGKRMSV